MTTLARCAETRAYTPPDDPTTGAVMSVMDAAKEPAVRTKYYSLVYTQNGF